MLLFNFNCSADQVFSGNASATRAFFSYEETSVIQKLYEEEI